LGEQTRPRGSGNPGGLSTRWPDFEVTGTDAKGKRVGVISDGLWQI
jgi:hypothetical protein